jgi:hypothetical protein
VHRGLPVVYSEPHEQSLPVLLRCCLKLRPCSGFLMLVWVAEGGCAERTHVHNLPLVRHRSRTRRGHLTRHQHMLEDASFVFPSQPCPERCRRTAASHRTPEADQDASGIAPRRCSRPSVQHRPEHKEQSLHHLKARPIRACAPPIRYQRASHTSSPMFLTTHAALQSRSPRATVP